MQTGAKEGRVSEGRRPQVHTCAICSTAVSKSQTFCEECKYDIEVRNQVVHNG